MSIDYDKIQQGRRREWKELLSPEERARRRKEEAAQDPDQSAKPKSWLRLRDEKLEVQRENDRAAWAAAKRKVQRILIILFLVIGTLMGLSIAWVNVSRQRLSDKFAKLDPIVIRGQTFQGYGDPVEAWASWRSAMVRRDGRSLARVESPTRQERNRGKRDLSAYIAQLDSQLKRKRMEHERALAIGFATPTITTMPDSPWSDGELAVITSPPMARPGARPSDTRTIWVAAFSYHRKTGEWRFEDLREQRHWDSSWRFATQLRPVMEMQRKAERKRADERAFDP